MKYERVTLEYQFDCSRCEDRQCTKDGFCCDETFCKTYNRLAELEDKIENGTLVELPCKVGDTVYYETFINNGSESVGIQPHEVKSIYTSIVTSNFSGYGYTIVELDEFGKTVFLTKAEAEKRLEEIKGDR